MSVKGPLIVWLVSLWGWTKGGTEGLLQTVVLQGQDSTQEPALDNKTTYKFSQANKRKIRRKSRNVYHYVSNSLNLSAVRRKAQSSRAMRKTKEAVAEPIRTIENVSSSTP